jgi:hypothetical protein
MHRLSVRTGIIHDCADVYRHEGQWPIKQHIL